MGDEERDVGGVSLEQPAVRATIVGGPPPGQGKGVSLIPLIISILSVFSITSASDDCFVNCGYDLTDRDSLISEIEKADKGNIHGYVIDNEGKPISTALITIEYKGFGFFSTTDNEGSYKLEGIPIGTYEVNATRPGYVTVVKSCIEIKMDDYTRVDFELERPPDFEKRISTDPPLIDFKETGKENG
jgi:hypothetical protein